MVIVVVVQFCAGGRRRRGRAVGALRFKVGVGVKVEVDSAAQSVVVKLLGSVITFVLVHLRQPAAAAAAASFPGGVVGRVAGPAPVCVGAAGLRVERVSRVSGRFVVDWCDPIQGRLAHALAWGEESGENALNQRLQCHDARTADGRVDFNRGPVDHASARICRVEGQLGGHVDESNEADDRDDADAKGHERLGGDLGKLFEVLHSQKSEGKHTNKGVLLPPRELQRRENRHLVKSVTLNKWKRAQDSAYRQRHDDQVTGNMEGRICPPHIRRLAVNIGGEVQGPIPERL